MAAIGFSTGYYRLGEVNLHGMPLRLLTVLIVPALGEELVFRGLLLPDSRRPALWVAVSTALYVAWHPLETLTFLPAATDFLRPDFLAATAVLGLGCALMRLRTGSLWPAVALHWLLVTLWQTFLGAPTLDQLR